MFLLFSSRPISRAPAVYRLAKTDLDEFVRWEGGEVGLQISII